ncbi:MAG: hypothetical protein Q8M53_13320 [Burkholderiales bacterium]|nr:hypothetical protein [Burkholderiales bacterium]
MPRDTEQISPWQTYPELLIANLVANSPGQKFYLYNRSIGGATVDILHDFYINDCSYFGAKNNQIIIIQCGVVDCAPRPIPKKARTLLGKLHGRIRTPISKLLHILRPLLLRSGIFWRLTDEGQFSTLLCRWLDHAERNYSHVYVINIAPTTSATSRHSPGLQDSINKYNELIKSAVEKRTGASLINAHSEISKSDNIENFITHSDGHHINMHGHFLYADLITQFELARLKSQINPVEEQQMEITLK